MLGRARGRHTHYNNDVVRLGTRLLSNQHGYAQGAAPPETKGYDPKLAVAVECEAAAAATCWGGDLENV